MDKIRLQGTSFDKRRKLTDGDKAEIKEWYRDGTSIRTIAKAKGVSRRLIQFVLFPERHAQNLIARAERGGSMRYYTKEKHTRAVRKYRTHLGEVKNQLERAAAINK